METNVINTPIDPKQIPGWGVDADPKNDPTYPMRARMNVTQDPDSKHRPTLQPLEVEKLRSIERPNVSAVYGTTVPPMGLSGAIRRLAFKYSENRYRHWLPLIVADRVQVVEGILDDLVHGTVPNIWAEKGYDVEWKHNRTAFITKMATIAALTAGTIVWLSSGNKEKGFRRRDNQRRY
ncbi:hypothetical protein [Hymenobacter chitinivorans]|uniref:Uncharacterized protein n=1 Tax=Hymenobacter chitinivorans DSM 11115 TaxID=1121954 RepID=A0A2M9BQH0_9BACT|nr:hypothetical protein [Hymenobacter chitinivorans]PJJ60199.1 hypothetical protein CLV45_1624 [Hymenobacter chitinivorans DSM 11115]